MSLIQPTNAPPNVQFFRENAEKDEWIFKHKFDYIHLRLTFTCFDDPRVVIRKSFENLKPGGWIEWCDGTPDLRSFDGSIHGTMIEKWTQTWIAGARALGRDMLVTRHYHAWLLEAGFVDVVEKNIPCPGNSWPSDPKFKLVGRWEQNNLLDGLQGVSIKLLKAAGMPDEEIEPFLTEVAKAIQDTNIHFYWPM